MRYFHIQRINGVRKELKKGAIKTTERVDFNNFYKDILEGIERNSIPHMGEERLIQRSKQVLSYSWSSELNQITGGLEKKYYKTQDFCNNFNNLANQLYNSQLQYLKWIREEIFEKNRLIINPKLPSRKKCIWLSCENNLEYWWNILPNPNNSKIKELELDKTGKIHLANQEFLNIETYSIAQFNKNSIDYWNGKMHNQANTEILYEGKFRVISEFNDLDQI